MYGKLYSMCGYSQQADTSNTHFLSPNAPNYYSPQQFYEDAQNVTKLDIKHPQQLKFGDEDYANKPSPFKFEDENKSSCRSCGSRESYNKIKKKTPMFGAKQYEPGSKTVVNCTSCYSGQGKHAIPVTNVDSSDTRLAKTIFENPRSCNNPDNTLSKPSHTSDFGWGKSRWNKITENYDSFSDYLKTKGNNGLDKKEWGPHVWEMLHVVTFSYPLKPTFEKQRHTWNFFNSLHAVLACQLCGIHCKEYIEKNPPPVDSGEKLKRWGWNFHNSVNEKLGKKKVSWEECTKRYQSGNICSN